MNDTRTPDARLRDLPPMTESERDAWAAFGRAMDEGGDPRAIFEARESVRRATLRLTGDADTPEPRLDERALKEAWVASGLVMLDTNDFGVRVSDTEAVRRIVGLLATHPVEAPHD